MKSSQERTRFTLTRRLRLLAVGSCSLRFFSNPSQVRWAHAGDAGPPCGVPLSVGLRRSFSLNSAFSHLWSIDLSIGLCASNHSWEMVSKQDRLSPSTIHAAPPLLLTTMWHCAIASAVDRADLHPEECGSAWHSARGSRACRESVCIALSSIVGTPTVHYIFSPTLFGICDHHSPSSSSAWPTMCGHPHPPRR